MSKYLDVCVFICLFKYECACIESQGNTLTDLFVNIYFLFYKKAYIPSVELISLLIFIITKKKKFLKTLHS